MFWHAGSLSGLTRRGFPHPVATEPPVLVIGQCVPVVAAGGVEPHSPHRRSNSLRQANANGQKVTAEALADLVEQQSEGIWPDLTTRWHHKESSPAGAPSMRATQARRFGPLR